MTVLCASLAFIIFVLVVIGVYGNAKIIQKAFLIASDADVRIYGEIYKK